MITSNPSLRSFFWAGFFCCMLVHTTACEKVFFSPTITTGEASHISSVNAILSGSINKQYRDAEMGFEVALAASFSEDITEKTAVKDMESNNTFTKRVRIDPEKTYYYRSYVTLGDKTVYGETKSFKSLPLSTLIRCDVSIVSPTTATVTLTGDLTDCENEIPCGILELFVDGKSRQRIDFAQKDIFNPDALTIISSTSFTYTKTYTNLSPDTTYSVSAKIYVHFQGGRPVGPLGVTKEFVTMPTFLEGAVDMGLSVKWASFNIGATKLVESGDLYAWGETETKTIFNEDNYVYCEIGKWYYYYLTKYCTNSEDGKDGFVDNKTVLDPEDDVAHIKHGSPWRMPTVDEWTELRDTNNNIWTSTTVKGTRGVIVSSKKTGNSIFLPSGSFGRYWSSSLNTDNSHSAWCVYTDSNQKSIYRYAGCAVRPVCEY